MIYNNLVYIGLGSNKEDKELYLKTAIDLIDADSNCSLEKVSSFYETKPFGYINQSNFINAVAEISTKLTVTDLFFFFKGCEKKLGRIPAEHWGPREIDLDILFYNELIYQDENIIVPHQGIVERDFVLEPMCEISPEFIHPALNMKICDIDKSHLTKNIIRKYQSAVLI